MDEKREFDFEPEGLIEEAEPAPYAKQWFSDDYEKHFQETDSTPKSMTVYTPKQKKKKGFFRSPLFVGILSSFLTCCLCLGVFSYYLYRGGNQTSENVLPLPGEALAAAGYGDRIKQMTTDAGQHELSIPDVYDLVSPAVVTILCKSPSGSYVQSQLSSGSGIIIRGDGYIVTNNHVVESATEITVNTIAGQSFPAKVIGKDSRTDLAVLKVESETALPFAELGDSSQIRVGEMALAIGNPLREELAGTLTVGYISAINRSMLIDGKPMTMIQTDAAINPGNSGGALLNLHGQVIGINTAKSTGYDVEGLGFAIPINEAKPIIESIIKHGYVTGRVVIGIEGQTITEAIAKANNLPVGVYVKTVLPGSAAEKGGLQSGDVIIACDGESIKTIDEINKIRDTHSVGEKMTMRINRDGLELNVDLILQEEVPEKEATPTQAPVTQTPQQPQQPFDYFPFPFSWFGW